MTTSQTSPWRGDTPITEADDTDTVAAVTGQLAGALYGLSGIPDGWLDRLAWKDRLMEAAHRLLVQNRICVAPDRRRGDPA